MTDLEICKRIAEIENKTFEVNHWGDVFTTNVGLRKFYNPLIDKALCFDLMVKYNVVFLDSEASVTTLHSCNGYAEHPDPQKAICLAIIDSHKG